MNFSQASKQRSRYDLRHILKDTVVDIKPNDAVTFVDNHEWVCSFVNVNSINQILAR